MQWRIRWIEFCFSREVSGYPFWCLSAIHSVDHEGISQKCSTILWAVFTAHVRIQFLGEKCSFYCNMYITLNTWLFEWLFVLCLLVAFLIVSHLLISVPTPQHTHIDTHSHTRTQVHTHTHDHHHHRTDIDIDKN